MTWKYVALPVIALPALALIAWGGLRLYKTGSMVQTSPDVPSTRVKRSDVTFTVTAKAELEGGKSEMLMAPMMGGGQLILTSLRNSGELVKQGEVVVQFDTTEQEFKLKEAEADLAEAEQQVAQAQADSQAKAEEAQYELVQAKAELRQAELEERRNPLLAAITARQNTLAVEAARDKLRQLEHDIPNRQATSTAGIAIQEAARNKAKVQAETAQRNIESMTLKAHMGGYVSVQQNMGGNFFMDGMKLPIFQVGDTVRPGMPVAQIPDFSNWEATARIGELDRGHLAEGQKAGISVVAIPEKTFAGHIKNIGGTGGVPWDRHFDCSIAIDNPSPELRPGMSANVVITTETLRNVSWIPAQAVFESDGRSFVYLQSGAGFVPADIKVVRRSESQVVVTGLKDGAAVAMANPGEQGKKTGSGAGAMQAIPK
ncbi:MAG TPA: HlyD family efflux transporter periplasmic adaptor subunit [Bryobacteraceae bacterium]|nr:HlyD family efflux transporter periplasmic adaptor subunit [Bryobacteraceae bacterium]